MREKKILGRKLLDIKPMKKLPTMGKPPKKEKAFQKAEFFSICKKNFT